jgi:tRNA-splicing ligase RtcB
MNIDRKRVSSNEILIPRQGSMRVDASIYASEEIKVEETAIRQLVDGASIPGVRRALATPDIHQGYGVPIGSVLGLEGTISPAAVGYDINCGMRMIQTQLQADGATARQIARKVNESIPLGEGKTNLRLSKNDLELLLTKGVSGLTDISVKNHPALDYFDKNSVQRDMRRIEDGGSMNGSISSLSKRTIQRGLDQLGTLGGGNHFVEIQIVSEIFDPLVAKKFNLSKDQLVVMIHSGSRGLGHQVGSEYMKLAKSHSKGSAVPFFDLDSKEGLNYLGAMQAAANFAFVNRHVMGLLVCRAIENLFPEAKPELLYDVPHNIAKFETHSGKRLMVHRKGATRAFGPRRMRETVYSETGQPVLIPGSMGTASYLLAGIDTNKPALASVNHGAGRVMSRVMARGKRQGNKVIREAAISDEELAEALGEVYLKCENPRSIKEEAPQAYKDIDAVIETVVNANMASKVAKMKPLAVLKG